MKIITIIALSFLVLSNNFCSKSNFGSNSLQKVNQIKDKEFIGFLVLDKKATSNLLTVYDANHKTSMQFKLSNFNTKFQPFAYHPDNFLLVFRCVSKVGDLYKIIIDEKRNDFRYISIQDKNFNFQTTEKHILSAFSVDFNKNVNPIRVNPSGNAQVIPYDNDEFYMPVKTSGKWLQIKWGTENNWEYGWIKWSEGGRLLIELFYFA